MKDPLRDAIIAHMLHSYYERVFLFATEVAKNANVIGMLQNSNKVQEELDKPFIDILNKYIEEQFGFMIEEYLTKYEENAGYDWSSYAYWTEVLHSIKNKT